MTQGVLYVVATPIGNLEDISLRATRQLSEVTLILAEDTRHTQNLLHHLNVRTPLSALHDHNEAAQVQSILQKLQAGDDLALVSDAGTPLISDPGYRLVRAALEAGIRVSPVPGACAMVAALSVAGVASDRFAFEGFLPAKTVARRSRLAQLRLETRTLVFYEAPHRVLETLQDMWEVMGARELTLCRELTKTFETVRKGVLSDILLWVQQDTQQQRGEIVLVLAGAAPETADDQENNLRILYVLLDELPLRQAVDLAVRLTGCRKKWLYDAALARGKRDD
ncbi:MAG: 16S rRNA (cytidine(1402)-2'-O)-methyltransferase [Pseudomonadales bacterium]|nr:16S rRNA (cytidine(1402)-2'-O)-methyltransferase [Pseudomonadales bacterium]